MSLKLEVSNLHLVPLYLGMADGLDPEIVDEPMENILKRMGSFYGRATPAQFCKLRQELAIMNRRCLSIYDALTTQFLTRPVQPIRANAIEPVCSKTVNGKQLRNIPFREILVEK